jgi:uncharacterized protein YciI
MPQFLILAHDGSDPEAPARRQTARPAHLEGISPRVERGEIVAGGAILDDDGHIVGSAVIADFPSRAKLDAWLAADPYVTQGVWQRVEVKPYRLVVMAKPRSG